MCKCGAVAQEAWDLENLYIHIAPRSGALSKLEPATLRLFRALRQMRALKHFNFSVQHPLNTIPIDRLSLQGTKERKEFEEKIGNINKALDDWVHRPRGFQTIGVDRVVSREFARTMVVASLDS
jgi:hypothetical protein